MNEILQKRIEEAKKKIIQEYIESFRYENGIELEPAVKIFLEKIGSIFFEHGISFALQNQWISVEEALPEKIKDKNYSKYVLIRQEYYEHEYHVIAKYDYGFDMWVSTNYFKPEFITHWMPIPSLEGGEE